MKQSLVLFTADFPFGTGETFLETEIIYLCKAFQEVIIISQNSQEEQTRNVPLNCTVKRMDVDYSLTTRMISLFQLFNPVFWQELKIIRSVYQKKVTSGIVKTMFISLQRGKKAKKYIQKHFGKKIDTTLFYSYWCDDMALGIALAAKKNKGIKGISRIHRWDVYFEESTVGYLPFRHFIVENLKTVFSISIDGIQYVEKEWKVKTDGKFQLSRLGINNHFPIKKVMRDYVLLVSCSNMIPVKRVSLIAKALTDLEHIQLKWVHIGDGSEQKNIEEIAKSFPSNLEVEFKGRIPNSEIYNYYDENRPDIFINVSSSEGIPVSIMEAMSFGIPVIATNVGGNREIVSMENGILLGANPTPFEIRAAIPILLADTMKKDAAFETWKEDYDATVNYSQFISFLSE